MQLLKNVKSNDIYIHFLWYVKTKHYICIIKLNQHSKTKTI